MNFADIFGDDAFSLTSMIAAINEVDHVPSRAGELAFAGTAEGVNTTSIVIERKGEALTLVPTSPRGGPAPKEKADKGNLRSTVIPHIQIEDTVRADEVIGVREFGTTDQMRTVQSVVNGRLRKMASRLDLTLEHHRLGALMGQILDSDGSVLTDLFELFGVKNSADVVGPEVFDVDFDGLASEKTDLRVKCQVIKRFLQRNAKTVLPAGWTPWVFCGDNFFDALVSQPDVKEVYKQTSEQERRLGDNYAFGVFEFGGIVWENYRGTDDNTTVGINTDEARGFIVGAPGLYSEFYAPADYMETVNTLGLPRYAKLAPDTKFNKFVDVEAQTNPLPLCMRPKTLIKLVK
ncbi:major capsid protein [Bradyrhizobium sp. 153]|uniref:major capsid protein n=1 Tax=Bradyrhizobium sp. 153 TaxID=2782627 RepID=UPI001FF710CE|nr:major capsid protein [Bradyrhizobium sp. 153]MCK1668627.1 major capsid protein [Bradyrhizobium sp. 153]